MTVHTLALRKHVLGSDCLDKVPTH